MTFRIFISSVQDEFAEERRRLKDMWTTARLREVGVTNRQMLAMPTLKTKHEMAVAEYMELTGVTRNTATADLVALAKAGIVKRIGAGRGATYVLQKCTINAQNAQPNAKVAKTEGNPINDSISDMINPVGRRKTVEKTVEKILSAMKDNPSITQRQLVKTTGLSRRGIEWQLNQLKAKGIIRRIGPDKGGRWEVVE